MANRIHFKMFYVVLLFLLIVNNSFAFGVGGKKDRKKCSCYDFCAKNDTSHSVEDIKKFAACQRGCRFFSLVWHTSTDPEGVYDGCLSSCSESYSNKQELYACSYGCLGEKYSKTLCTKNEIPQITYSLVIEESDVLIHPGEPDPDDVLTDPGLRKQFEKTLEVLLDAKPKLPEIHFRNLPIRNHKSSPGEYSHGNFKCPKFYELKSTFEFINVQFIIEDLYLFIGVFVFVVVCFLLGHHIETKKTTKQLMDNRTSEKDEYNGLIPLIKEDVEEYDLIRKESPPEYTPHKSESFQWNGNKMEEPETKYENIELVFNNLSNNKENNSNDHSIKI